tara:strand:+ start:799 stop:1041 length:243 start_codon:yes stop_codon:yes gene_type:complete
MDIFYLGEKMKDKLKELHTELAEKLLEKVRDEEVTASELNVARQFLRDNGVDAMPTDDSPLKSLMNELPFNDETDTPQIN